MNSVFKNCAPDFVNYGSGESTPQKNIDSVKAFMTTFLKAFPDLKVRDLDVFAHGDTVIIFGNWSGTFKAALGDMKPTGKSFNLPDADIYTFNSAGKITSYRSVQSSDAYFSQVANKTQ